MAPVLYPPPEPKKEDETRHGAEPHYTSTTTSYMRIREAAYQSQVMYLEEAALAREQDVGHGDHAGADLLRTLLTHRFGNCVRGWRCALDPSRRFQVSMGEFATTLRRLGFAGDAKEAWVGLGGAKRGMITLADVDEDSARKLKGLHAAFEETGESLKTICENRDSFRIDVSQFLDACKKLKKAVKKPEQVFALLPNGGESSAYVTMEDAVWLDLFCVPPKSFEPKPGPRRSCTRALELRTEAAVERRRLFDAGRQPWQERPPSRSRAVENLRLLLHHKHGSICRAWWDEIDKDAMGIIPRSEFLTAVERIGYKGDLNALWHGLVRHAAKETLDKGITVSDLDAPDSASGSGSGSSHEDVAEGDLISLDDLEPRAPMAVKNFQEACSVRFGSVAQAFERLEAKEKPLITNFELFTWCQIVGLQENAELLWAYLDQGDKGVISLEALDQTAAHKVYDKKQLVWAKSEVEEKLKVTHPTRRIPIHERATTPSGQRPENEEYRSRDDFIKLLMRRYGSVIRAWRRALDKDGNGKLSRNEFMVNVRCIGFKGNLEELWRQFELDLSGSLTLEDIDPESQEECKNFYDCICTSLGGLEQAFKTSNNDKNGQLKYKEFLALCNAMGFEGNTQRLWSHLDVDGSGQLALEDVQFLEQMEHFGDMSELLAQETRKRKGQKALAREQRAQERDTTKFVKEHNQIKLRVLAEKNKEKLRTEFIQTLSRRYGSVVKGWHRFLDPQKKGKIGYHDFRQKMCGIAGKGKEAQSKIDDLWEQLVHPDGSEHLELRDLDPLAHAEVDRFKEQCLNRYGTLEKAFCAIDRDGSGTVSYQEFKEWCADIKFTGSERRLFDFLDNDGSGSIGLKEIDPGTAKKARQALKDIDFRNETTASRENKHQSQRQLEEMREAWARQKVLDMGAKNIGEFRKLLVRRFGSIVKAWRKGLSPDGTRRIGFVKFCERCRKVGYAGSLDELWQSMGCDDRTPLSLEIIEPAIAKDLTEFREKMLDRFGSIKAAFEFIDQDGSMSVDLTEFSKACREVQFIGNERRLFEYLDTDDSGSVSLQEVDKDAASMVISDRKKKDKEHQALKKETELEAKQKKEKLAEEDKGDIGAKTKVGFLKLLERKFGTVLRAWRKALDTDGNGRLSYIEFCSACRALGYAGNVKTLWKILDDDNSGHISIKELDPEGARLIQSFLSGCAKRLGGLRAAFGSDGSLRLRKDDFKSLCHTIGIKEKDAWEKLFGFLDHMDHQSITFEDVRFLKDDAKRRKKVDVACIRDGPLHLRLRPRPVGFKKAKSLPSLQGEQKSKKVKDAWNCRHHVLDRTADTMDQLLWDVIHIKQREHPAAEGHWTEWVIGEECE